MFFLFHRGLHLSVEFTGGTVMEVGYSQPADVEKVRGTVAGLGFADVQVQNFGTARDVHDPPAGAKRRELGAAERQGARRPEGGRPGGDAARAPSSSARRWARSSPPTA